MGRGGAEVLVTDLMNEWSNRGHECHLCSLTYAGTINASASNEDAMRFALASSGIRVWELRLKSRTNLLLGLWRFRKVLRAIKPDAVHLHTILPVFFLLFSGTKVFYTHHNSIVTFPNLVFVLANRIVKRYIAIGDKCAQILKARTGRNVALIPNAVKWPKELADMSKRAGRKGSVALVGNINVQKNYLVLTEIINIFQRKYPDRICPQFEVAGSGDQTELLAALEKAGLADKVTLLGATDGPYALFARSALLLNCSKWEGLPISMIEAAMAGLPIVATDSGDVAMIVRDGENGHLAPVDDLEGLADGIASLLASDAVYKGASKRSVEIAREFDIQKCARLYLAQFAR